MSTTRLIAGCMTGTSIDSLDAALVRIHGTGLRMRAEVVRSLTRPLGELGPPLRRLAEQEPMTAGQIARLSRDFSLLHLAALTDLIAADRADLTSIHGQTVFHAPPASWQLLTPAVIAQGLRIPVVCDLRAADLSLGGQGAPITPIADYILFRGHTRGFTAIVNLGGFCNITVLPQPEAKRVPGPGSVVCEDQAASPDTELALWEPNEAESAHAVSEIAGMDVCACNHLLDGISRALLGSAFDAGGERAARGQPNAGATDDLKGVLIRQRREGRSLGTGDEVGVWIGRWQSRANPEDLAATACEAIAQTIARELGGINLILLAGGGVKNKTLVEAITSCCSSRVTLTEEFGIPTDYREAIDMAVLGALCQDRVPITLPQVTGVRAAPIAGTWVLP